jgi:hypothetical protein
LGGPQHLKLMHKDVQPPASVYLQHWKLKLAN